jgi:hypothetical protein
VSTIIPEILLTVSVILYMVWEFNQASMVTFVEYFSHFWGLYDWCNFALFIIAYSFRWAAYDRAKVGINMRKCAGAGKIACGGILLI